MSDHSKPFSRSCPNQGFREGCRITVRCSGSPSSSSEDIHNLLVEVVPSDSDLRDIIVRHRLFSKEMLVYEEVLPMLKTYIREVCA